MPIIGKFAFDPLKTTFPLGGGKAAWLQCDGRRFDSIRQMYKPEITIIADPA